MLLLLSALVLGVSSGLHCSAMCGPIMLAAMPRGGKPFEFILDFLQYHLARVLAYASLGFLLGWLGKGAFLIGLQQVISVATVIFLLSSFFFSFRRVEWLTTLPLFRPFRDKVDALFSRLLRSKHPWKQAGLGFLNGFIPCGIIYYALAVSLNTFHPLGASLYMLAFGIGTIPVLFVFLFLVHRSGATWFQKPYIRYAAVLIASAWILMRVSGTDTSWIYSAGLPAGSLCR